MSGLLGPLEHGMAIVRSVRRFDEGPDRSSMYRAHYEEWVADLAKKARDQAGSLEALAERMAALDANRERMLVLGNYGFEAWREAIDRRRKMLGDAAVATVFSELSAAELARIERTIRMLDPEDLEILANLARPPADSSALSERNRAVERYDELMQGRLGGAALVASGCVRMWKMDLAGMLAVQAPKRHVGAAITGLGELVLRFMGMEAASQSAASI